MKIHVEFTPSGDVLLTIGERQQVLTPADAVRLADALNALLDDPTDEEPS